MSRLAQNVCIAAVSSGHQTACNPCLRRQRAGRSPQAALQHLDADEMARVYGAKAAELQAAGRYRDAEACYSAINREDTAAEMYKAARLYGDYLRLARRGPPDALATARAWVAGQREAEGNFRCVAPAGSGFAAPALLHMEACTVPCWLASRPCCHVYCSACRRG
jgi:hypothetical protein